MEWRDVPGFPGYRASSWGQIQGPKRVLKQQLWQSPNQKTTQKYRVVKPVVDGKNRTMRVHSLVCLAFHGERPPGAVTRHLDGDSLNNCADNLTWGTHQENHDDMRQHRRHHNSLKTHCPRCGTPYPVATFEPGEVRRCAPCRREQIRRANARQRAKRRAVR